VPEIFTGEGLHKVDGKGRVSIPAAFRRVLEEGDPDLKSGKGPRVYIAYGDPRKPYLECYTANAFHAIAARILAMPLGDRHRRYLQTNFLGKTHTAEIEPDGRLVLPQKARDKAGLALNSEAYFLGAGDVFQIWNPDRHAEAEAEIDLLADAPADFDMLSLIHRAGPPGGQGG
jgi:MraZ protein